MELLLISSGNASEALQWLTEVDRQYKLTNPGYGIGDFIEDQEECGNDRKPSTGELKVNAKGVQQMRQSALEEIFGKLRKSRPGDHKTPHSGRGDESTTDRRDYEFGDTLEQISMTDSLRNAQINHGLEEFTMTEEDLEVVESEFKSQTSTVLMIDISHSMILYGEDRITPAKKVAMALAELITKKYAKDTLDIRSATTPGRSRSKTCPIFRSVHTTPTRSPVSNSPWTSCGEGKMPTSRFMITMANRYTKEASNTTRTASVLDHKILNKTLTLATQLRKIKIPVTTFMIATDPYLKAFVREFTKANSGNAYYSSLQGLGNLVFEDFKKNRRKTL